MRSKGIDIGRLEMRLDNITCAFKESSDEKDAQIADLSGALEDGLQYGSGLDREESRRRRT